MLNLWSKTAKGLIKPKQNVIVHVLKPDLWIGCLLHISHRTDSNQFVSVSYISS